MEHHGLEFQVPGSMFQVAGITTGAKYKDKWAQQRHYFRFASLVFLLIPDS